MESQTVEVNVVAVAVRTLVRTLSRVQPFVQFEVDKLCKLGWTDLALVGLFTRVQPQMGFQVAGAAETLVTHLRGQSRVLGSVRRTCPETNVLKLLCLFLPGTRGVSLLCGPNSVSVGGPAG